jgi:GalNAc-alpha-(1->4)-GalNAc-alpha-(1->3)-diNAcBac-PP-undecaprenol alpha-1,4-N-acetyl-D-galactosaminyltransferase
MDIVFVIFNLGTGGAERAVTGLANYYVKKHNVTIITLVKTKSFYPLDKNINLKHCLNDTVEHTNLIKSIKNGLFRWNRLINHLKEIKPKVVISFMHTSNIYTIWACKWFGIPCIISERANHAIDQLPKTHEIIRNLSYPYCSRLIVQTKGNLDYYSTILPKRKIKIIPNAVAQDLRAKRSKTNITDSKVILNVGSFKNGKAQDVLIRSFSLLPKNDWNLIFLGKGPNLVKFKALAKQLGVDNRIAFEGAQKDVASYYNKASMFVFTSEHEGFPNALLEALYFGVPAISTNCPHGPADLIENGVNGFLIPVGDQNVLTNKMEVLINNKELRKSFSIQAIEKSKQYEIENIAKKWMELLKSVLSNK